MKEFRNWTVFDFRGSNVLAWRSLPVVETSRLSGSRQYTTSPADWQHTALEEALGQFTPWLQRDAEVDRFMSNQNENDQRPIIQHVSSNTFHQRKMRWFC